MEYKNLSGVAVKFAVDADTGMKFSGYGSVFGNIAPGAFARSLAAHKSANSAPLMFLNHDMNSLPIGRWIALSEDGTGLKVEGELLDTQAGRDTYTALKAGAIDGLSIGYRPIEFTNRAHPDDPRRTLKSLDLVEVSVVTLPANRSARIGEVKSLITLGHYHTELIRLGMTDIEAEAFIEGIEAKYTNKGRISAAQALLAKLK
jgi:HK97 family phage prohead protease